MLPFSRHCGSLCLAMERRYRCIMQLRVSSVCLLGPDRSRQFDWHRILDVVPNEADFIKQRLDGSLNADFSARPFDHSDKGISAGAIGMPWMEDGQSAKIEG